MTCQFLLRAIFDAARQVLGLKASSLASRQLDTLHCPQWDPTQPSLPGLRKLSTSGVIVGNQASLARSEYLVPCG